MGQPDAESELQSHYKQFPGQPDLEMGQGPWDQ